MKYTNRVFIDLDKYSERVEALEVMERNFRSMKEFEGREGTRLFFLLDSEYERLNFILSISGVLKKQGYMIEIVDEVDNRQLKINEKKSRKTARYFNPKAKVAKEKRKGYA
ncbi:hypothetical protein [Mongoliitalea daihaiensis]|uniref:hypothetical protein n=1 Tax=Mongoliitalea daihaiensis TaxID=2782006 RepID=UPI001F46DC3D|nr:hypothetical protein [Mongoliitalea daihaiensis]UJP63970.1 hypothetical protein IPZ59_14220 [Mongoliitalea daihaiensis]